MATDCVGGRGPLPTCPPPQLPHAAAAFIDRAAVPPHGPNSRRLPLARCTLLASGGLPAGLPHMPNRGRRELVYLCTRLYVTKVAAIVNFGIVIRIEGMPEAESGAMPIPPR